MATEIFDDRGQYSDEERVMMREAGITVQTPSPVPSAEIVESAAVNRIREAMNIFLSDGSIKAVLHDHLPSGGPPEIRRR